MFQAFPYLLLVVVLYIKAFQYTNSTLIDDPASNPELVLDDFRQWENPTNVLEGNRVITSMNPQNRLLASLSSCKEYLIEYLPPDLADRNYSLLRITYSTTKCTTNSMAKNRVGMVLRSDHRKLQSYFFDWKLQRGNRVELNISTEFLIKLAHEFQIDSSLGIIIRGPLKIHQIEFITANSGETNIPFQIPKSNFDILDIIRNPRLIINLPPIPVNTASTVNESELMLDDFSQWQNPKNVRMGNRVIASKNPQHQGFAILSSAIDYLIEYLPTELDYNNYSSLCITYSTIGLTSYSIMNRVGMVLRTDTQKTTSFFFDWKLQKGKRAELNISIEFIFKLAHEFEIDSNIGIIIRGPLKIHRIDVLTARTEIAFQIPAPNVDIREIVKHRHLFINLPAIPVIPASNIMENALVLDDFMQWDDPPNVLINNRVIVSKLPQCPGHAILSSPEDHLIEYFPTELADKNYSSLRITYSTSTSNNRYSLSNRVGMIQRPNDRQKDRYFFRSELRKGKKVRMRIPIQFLRNIWSDFRIDCNYGIIIRGPLKIHSIELLSADKEEPGISFEKQGFYHPQPALDGQIPDQYDSETDIQVHDKSLFEVDNESINQFLFSELETLEPLSANWERPDISYENQGFYPSLLALDGQVPGWSDSELDKNALDQSSIELDDKLLNQFDLNEPETYEADHFSSHNNLLDFWSL